MLKRLLFGAFSLRSAPWHLSGPSAPSTFPLRRVRNHRPGPSRPGVRGGMTSPEPHRNQRDRPDGGRSLQRHQRRHQRLQIQFGNNARSTETATSSAPRGAYPAVVCDTSSMPFVHPTCVPGSIFTPRSSAASRVGPGLDRAQGQRTPDGWRLNSWPSPDNAVLTLNGHRHINTSRPGSASRP